MITFLHTFNPQSLLISGPWLNIHWYGLFMVLAILAALFLSIKLGKYYGISQDNILDLGFWLILGGLVGARIYEIFLVFDYYVRQPLDIFKIWQGGLAIHGAILTGLAIIIIFARQKKINFWLLTAIVVPGLALGQAIGRWGNYFNQELFGLPTKLPWGIPISPFNRPLEYIDSQFFHPTFLYESLGNLLIFLVLISIHAIIIKRRNKRGDQSQNNAFLKITLIYLALYSLLRFSLEFIRIDKTPTFLSLRWPQVISLLIIIMVAIIFFQNARKKSHEHRK